MRRVDHAAGGADAHSSIGLHQLINDFRDVLLKAQATWFLTGLLATLSMLCCSSESPKDFAAMNNLTLLPLQSQLAAVLMSLKSVA